MNKENEFYFDHQKNFETKLSFQIETYDNCFDFDIHLSCAKDFEKIMELYFNKEWKALFYEYNNTHHNWYKEITEVSFEGLYVKAKEKSKGFVYYRLDSDQKMNVTVDVNQLNDENAKKIKAIKEIIQ